MNKVSVTELGYIGIGVKDMSAWRTFASDILGMEYYEVDGAAKLRMDYWHHRILLQRHQEDDLLYTGYRVAGPEEFLMMQDQLSQCGVPFQLASPAEVRDRCVLELIKLEDPAGVPIEIFHGPRVDRHKPFWPGRGMHGKFVTGSGGLGHVIIREAGVEKSYRFYHEALGMRGSVEAQVDAEHQVIFMHCNQHGTQRDHAVAFGIGRMKKRIHHLMVEVDSMDDVGLAYDLARRNKVPILLAPGKHANDKALSFYMQTPSGWFCEYGYGGAAPEEQSEFNVKDIWGHELLAESLG